MRDDEQLRDLYHEHAYVHKTQAGDVERERAPGQSSRADTYAVVSAPEKKRAGFRALGQKVAMRVVINRRGVGFDLGADDGD